MLPKIHLRLKEYDSDIAKLLNYTGVGQNNADSLGASHLDVLLSLKDTYLPLAGGQLTGAARLKDSRGSSATETYIGALEPNVTGQYWTGWASTKGARVVLNSVDHNNASGNGPGYFRIIAQDSSGSTVLTGTPGGSLKWGNTEVSLAGHTHSDYVPLARTVNGKALSSNISLTAADVSALPLSGGTVTGTLNLTKTTDAEATSDNSPALRIGALAGAHLEFDGNEIMAKGSGTTVGSLAINHNGGNVSINQGTAASLTHNGPFSNTGTITVSGDHYSAGTTGILVTGGRQNFGIALQNTNVTKGTAPAAAINSDVEFYGTAHSNYKNRFGVVGNDVSTGNVSSMHMVAYSPASAETTDTCRISCSVDASGNKSVVLGAKTTISGAATINGVATVSGATTVNGGHIDLNGSSSYNSGAPIVNIKDTVAKRNTAPSARRTNLFVQYLDANNARMGGLYSVYETSKANSVALIAYNGLSTDSTWDEIRIGYDSTGKSYTKAPTPPAGDNSTKIATTAWVTKHASDSYARKDATLPNNILVRNCATNGISIPAGTWTVLIFLFGNDHLYIECARVINSTTAKTIKWTSGGVPNNSKATFIAFKGDLYQGALGDYSWTE